MRVFGFVLVIFAVAAFRPDLLQSIGLRLRLFLAPLVRRPLVAWLLVVALPLALRLATLSRWPIPAAKILDEFSYLYAADTFSSGRLANPPHPLWPFFETVYVLTQPVGASKYPPAQGLMLALGQTLLGDPWYGVWLSCGLMTAAFYWLLLACVPRAWALAGGLWFGLYTGMLTEWMNSYWGGAVAAAAGALLLGSFLRMRRQATPLLGVLYALGWVVLVNARPYEGGLLYGLPMAYLLYKTKPTARTLAALGGTLALGAACTMFYNYRVTGDALKLPYTLHDEQYAYVQPFWFQPLKPKPAYRQPVIANAFRHDEIRREELGQWKGWSQRAFQWRRTLEFYGPWLIDLPAVLALWWFGRTRRLGPLAAVLAIGFAGLNLTVFHFAHYAAPFAGLVVLFIVHGWRLLAHGVPTRFGRAAFAALAVYAGLTFVQSMRASLAPPSTYYLSFFRREMERHLELDIDQHVIFVTHPRVLKEVEPTWVYNKADPDNAKTVWAADLGETENQKLLAYYPTRSAWRLDLDDRTLTLQPYRPKPGQAPIQFIRAGRQFEEQKPAQ